MKKCCLISANIENYGFFECTSDCDDLFERIKELLLKLYRERDVQELLTAMNIGLETLAAEAVLTLKDIADIKLECVIPFEEQAKDWPEPVRNTYFGIIAGCDKETLITTSYSEDSINKCYSYIVDNSDVIILYRNAPSKETAELIENSGKEIIVLE